MKPGALFFKFAKKRISALNELFVIRQNTLYNGINFNMEPTGLKGKEGGPMRAWTKIISFIVLIAACVYAFSTDIFSLMLRGNPEEIRSLSGGSLYGLLLITLLLMIIQNLFTLIPLLLLITLNVSMFGFLQGYGWSWLTSIVGAMVSFGAVRYWFQDFFVNKLDAKWKDKIESRGFLFVFIGRIFPFAPTSVINIASGVSTIRFDHFVYSTMLGNGIFFFVLALIPMGLMSLQTEMYLVLAGAAILIAIVGLFLYRHKRKRMKKAILDDQGKQAIENT